MERSVGRIVLTHLSGIQGRLTLFALLIVLLSSAAVSMVAFYHAREALYAQMGDAIREIAAATGADVERFLAERTADIRVIARSSVLTSPKATTAEKEAFLRLIEESYEGVYKAIYLTDATGQIVAATDRTRRSQADQEWFKQASQNQLYLSDVHYQLSLQEVVVTVAMPILAPDYKVVGVVAVHLRAQTLFDVVGTRQVGETGELFLVNQEGQIVAEGHASEIFGDVSHLAPVQAALRGESGSATDVSHHGEDLSLYGYVPLAGPQRWIALAELPSAELEAPINALAWRIGSVTLMVVAVIGGLAFLAGQSLIGPLSRLTQAAQQLSQGDYTTAIPEYGDNEIGHLANSFREMVAAIQARDKQVTEYAAGLEKEIAERQAAEAERERLQQQIAEAQQQLIRELSTPIIPIIQGVIIMPLIGTIDTIRSRDITRILLAGITEYRAEVVILDITGVSVVDSGVAAHLDKTIRAARLKGAHTIITGISEAVAETIVDLGINWSGIQTVRDLQTGLAIAVAKLRQQ
jgi:anti-anti-sigma regulatory factor/HAMP domain-containing protein